MVSVCWFCMLCWVLLQAQVDAKRVKEVLGTIAGKVDEPKMVRGGLRW